MQHKPLKSKSSPTTRLLRRRGERMYSSYSFTTSALDEVNGQHHAPAALYPRYPMEKRQHKHEVKEIFLIGYINHSIIDGI